MDVREKLVKLLCEVQHIVTNTNKAEYLVEHGVTVHEDCKDCAESTKNCIVKLQEQIADLRSAHEWISVKERTPTEADGTVWVCLVDVFPYNEKEPYIDAKHDRRITEAFYSQFSKRWYKDGAVFPDGIVTHWMEKAQPPKGD